MATRTLSESWAENFSSSDRLKCFIFCSRENLLIHIISYTVSVNDILYVYVYHTFNAWTSSIYNYSKNRLPLIFRSKFIKFARQPFIDLAVKITHNMHFTYIRTFTKFVNVRMYIIYNCFYMIYAANEFSESLLQKEF